MFGIRHNPARIKKGSPTLWKPFSPYTGSCLWFLEQRWTKCTYQGQARPAAGASASGAHQLPTIELSLIRRQGGRKPCSQWELRYWTINAEESLHKYI
ncbi:hypothetical protein AMECASPLE_024570 [Ameca splendens]|uniref:Uncharacterized protein n=1 Tax=Ameca splendens TaxID=208324 RepID=A0ABV1A093_9TELE